MVPCLPQRAVAQRSHMARTQLVLTTCTLHVNLHTTVLMTPNCEDNCYAHLADFDNFDDANKLLITLVN